MSEHNQQQQHPIDNIQKWLKVIIFALLRSHFVTSHYNYYEDYGAVRLFIIWENFPWASVTGTALLAIPPKRISSTQNGTKLQNAHSWEATENDNNKNKEL